MGGHAVRHGRGHHRADLLQPGGKLTLGKTHGLLRWGKAALAGRAARVAALQRQQAQHALPCACAASLGLGVLLTLRARGGDTHRRYVDLVNACLELGLQGRAHDPPRYGNSVTLGVDCALSILELLRSITRQLAGAVHERLGHRRAARLTQHLGHPSANGLREAMNRAPVLRERLPADFSPLSTRYFARVHLRSTSPGLHPGSLLFQTLRYSASLLRSSAVDTTAGKRSPRRQGSAPRGFARGQRTG